MNRSDNPPPQTEIEIETDEGFVQRWSRRKLEAGEQNAAPAEIEPEAEPASEEPEPEPPGDEDMPPLDSLGPDSDVSPFFSPRVSEGLRQAALQRLFRQPQFNFSDGLDVYCENYRHFKPLGDIVTAAMRHRLEAARQRLARVTEQAEKLADDADRADNTTDEPRADQATTDAADPEDDNGRA